MRLIFFLNIVLSRQIVYTWFAVLVCSLLGYWCCFILCCILLAYFEFTVAVPFPLFYFHSTITLGAQVISIVTLLSTLELVAVMVLDSFSYRLVTLGILVAFVLKILARLIRAEHCCSWGICSEML